MASSCSKAISLPVGVLIGTVTAVLAALLLMWSMGRCRRSTYGHLQLSQASFDKQANGAGIANSPVPRTLSQQEAPVERETLLTKTPTRDAAAWKPGRSKSYSDNTVFFTPRLVSSQASKAFSALSALPETAEQNDRIPAPLWQELQIAAEDVAILQNAAGNDWLLGEGSSGKVA